MTGPDSAGGVGAVKIPVGITLARLSWVRYEDAGEVRVHPSVSPELTRRTGDVLFPFALSGNTFT